ncbi:hypothetical protein QFZ74_001925 [Streptomyces sp. V3I7]|nr:hypothetical protein [Streptomyces sp. V3I7]
MTWLLTACALGLLGFTALGIEDSHHHRALRATDQS